MLDDDQILSIVASELSQSEGGTENSAIDSDRQAALATYLGQLNGQEEDGRSSIVSTDVADAIEWIMPEIIKAFTQNNEVVTFDPVFEEDVDQAELESKYVYDILMKDNEGFIIIHQFVKDALMQKNGFIKVFYEKEDAMRTEHYAGLTEIEYASIISMPTVELMQETIDEDGPIPLYDIKVKVTEKEAKIRVVSVPPEEFRVNSMHNSVDLTSARFTAHVLVKTASDLVKMGVSKSEVDKLPTYQGQDSDREYRFYEQGENVYDDSYSSLDPSLRPVELAECFMNIDIDEDGIAELTKITTAGGDNPSIIIDIEPVDSNPFISSTAILMSHKLYGLSIYDRLKQIQDQKTTLWRNIFDNMYLQNNQRTVVIAGQVEIDDLMVSRPGGIIRTKSAGAVTPYVTPPLSTDAYQMMDYLDQVRASRSGASPDGAVQESMIGDRVGSEGIQTLSSQKEALVGLMIRVFAETGIKPLCYKIREQVVMHQDSVRQYKFRDDWVDVDPSTWNARVHSTVRVGTGSGNRKEQLNALSGVMAKQTEMLSQPNQTLVREQEVYTAMNDFCKFAGLATASKYFLNPKSTEGQEHKKQQDQQSQQQQEEQKKNEQVMLEAQAKIAEAEMQKASVAGENVKLKAQVDSMKNQLTLMKQTNESDVAYIKQQLEKAKIALGADEKDAELEYKYWQAKLNAETQLQLASQNNKESNNEQS